METILYFGLAINGQPESYQLAHWVSTDKRACVRLNGVVPELSASRKLPSELSGNVGHDGECHDSRQAANLLKGLVGARGFEPRTSCAQGSCKKSILLVRLALFCVMVRGFGPNLAAFGPKLDPSDRIWLRDSRKFLERKRLWLRRPDTYRMSIEPRLRRVMSKIELIPYVFLSAPLNPGSLSKIDAARLARLSCESPADACFHYKAK